MAEHTFITGQFVRIGQKLANASDRVFAYLIDAIFVFIASSLIMTFLAAMALSGGDFVKSEIYMYMTIVIFLTYPLWMESLCKGRTIGKMAMGIQVVSADGSTPSFASLFFRWIFFLVEGFTGFGIIVMLFTKDNQRLGDIAGGTYLVKARTPYFRGSLKRENFPSGYQPYFPQASQLSQSQIDIIPSLYYLKDTESEKLKQELCQKICTYLNISVSGWSTHRFLSQIHYDFSFLTASQET